MRAKSTAFVTRRAKFANVRDRQCNHRRRSRPRQALICTGVAAVDSKGDECSTAAGLPYVCSHKTRQAGEGR